ncbi:hypothetical protein, partial [Enterobacter hormaechei]|uniref:hypothetical protein n=1 Tax=Enterobacter hormaechei TaxID=158836 RepID=UPI0023ED398A
NLPGFDRPAKIRFVRPEKPTVIGLLINPLGLIAANGTVNTRLLRLCGKTKKVAVDGRRLS